MRQTDPVTNRDRDAPGPTGDAAAQLPPTDDAPSHEADPDAAGGSTESPGTLPSLLIWQHRLACGYSSAFGTPLAEPSELYDHPWALLCHGTEPDPLFVYANLTAQRLWERTLVDFLAGHRGHGTGRGAHNERRRSHQVRTCGATRACESAQRKAIPHH